MWQIFALSSRHPRWFMSLELSLEWTRLGPEISEISREDFLSDQHRKQCTKDVDRTWLHDAGWLQFHSIFFFFFFWLCIWNFHPSSHPSEWDLVSYWLSAPYTSVHTAQRLCWSRSPQPTFCICFTFSEEAIWTSFLRRFDLFLTLKSGLDNIRTLYILLFLENSFLHATAPAVKGHTV